MFFKKNHFFNLNVHQELVLDGRQIAQIDALLGFSAEVERILNTLPCRPVFTAIELCFEELITEFNASFEFHGSYVSFQFGGILR